MVSKYYIEYKRFTQRFDHSREIENIYEWTDIQQTEKYSIWNHAWIKINRIYTSKNSNLLIKNNIYLEKNLLKTYYEVPENEIDELIIKYKI